MISRENQRKNQIGEIAIELFITFLCVFSIFRQMNWILDVCYHSCTKLYKELSLCTIFELSQITSQINTATLEKGLQDLTSTITVRV